MQKNVKNIQSNRRTVGRTEGRTDTRSVFLNLKRGEGYNLTIKALKYLCLNQENKGLFSI